MLLIDHNMALVMGVCDRIHVLDQGRTLAAGTPDEIRGNLDVAAAYLGETAGAEPRRMPEPVLELERLEVRYGTVAAVRDVSLRVDKGEIVGLIGPNGAGKSTTLHAIMGVLPAHRGEIRLHGDSVRGRSPESIAHRGVALVPEGRRIFGDFTVEENLRLGLAAHRKYHGARTARAGVRPLPDAEGVPAPLGGRTSRAASSSSLQSAGRSSPSRISCCSTSRRSAWRR